MYKQINPPFVVYPFRRDCGRLSRVSQLETEQADLLRRHERTGRPLGDGAFLKRLEAELGRVLHKKPPGRKPGAEKNK
jgi:hypothetical protein